MQIVSVHEAPADLKCYSFIVCKYIILYFKIPWCRGEVGTVFCYWSPWIIDFNSIWPISLLVVITKMQPWFLSSQVRGCLGAWLQNTKIFCLFKFSVALGWIPWIYDLLHYTVNFIIKDLSGNDFQMGQSDCHLPLMH